MLKKGVHEMHLFLAHKIDKKKLESDLRKKGVFKKDVRDAVRVTYKRVIFEDT